MWTHLEAFCIYRTFFDGFCKGPIFFTVYESTNGQSFYIDSFKDNESNNNGIFTDFFVKFIWKSFSEICPMLSILVDQLVIVFAIKKFFSVGKISLVIAHYPFHVIRVFNCNLCIILHQYLKAVGQYFRARLFNSTYETRRALQWVLPIVQFFCYKINLRLFVWYLFLDFAPVNW